MASRELCESYQRTTMVNIACYYSQSTYVPAAGSCNPFTLASSHTLVCLKPHHKAQPWLLLAHCVSAMEVYVNGPCRRLPRVRLARTHLQMSIHTGDPRRASVLPRGNKGHHWKLHLPSTAESQRSATSTIRSPASAQRPQRFNVQRRRLVLA